MAKAMPVRPDMVDAKARRIAMERMATEDTARILASLEAVPLSELLQQATAMRRAGHGNVISYSRKVFIPLTQLCRDVCGYCTFAKAPREVEKARSGRSLQGELATKASQ
jgi:2-iminoacetate synthase ThiH